MPVYVALLRAVNVGGTGKLPMADLRGLCEALGFGDVRTYLASGNAVFSAEPDEMEVRSALEAGLGRLAGRPVGVLLRAAPEIARVLAANPFEAEPGDKVAVIFLEQPPHPKIAEDAKGRVDERIVAGTREVYVHYPQGMGRSRLRLPGADTGTARNLKTVAALVAMSEPEQRPSEK